MGTATLGDIAAVQAGQQTATLADIAQVHNSTASPGDIASVHGTASAADIAASRAPATAPPLSAAVEAGSNLREGTTLESQAAQIPTESEQRSAAESLPLIGPTLKDA